MHDQTSRQNGFTLVELVIVVAVIAILTSIALPNYRNYVIKSRITEATQALADYRIKYEQFFLDNRTYPVGADAAVCLNSTIAVPSAFNITCASTADTYTITATGRNQMLNYNYTINQANVKTSSTPWGNSNTCWVVGAGGLC